MGERRQQKKQWMLSLIKEHGSLLPYLKGKILLVIGGYHLDETTKWFGTWLVQKGYSHMVWINLRTSLVAFPNLRRV